MSTKHGSKLQDELPPSSWSCSALTTVTSLSALKYSNIGALDSESSSKIQTLTLARVIAVYRCFSSEFRTLCRLWSNARGRGRFSSFSTTADTKQHHIQCIQTYWKYLYNLTCLSEAECIISWQTFKIFDRKLINDSHMYMYTTIRVPDLIYMLHTVVPLLVATLKRGHPL